MKTKAMEKRIQERNLTRLKITIAMYPGSSGGMVERQDLESLRRALRQFETAAIEAACYRWGLETGGDPIEKLLSAFERKEI